MGHITWKDYYSVGHPRLDTEHKQIIGVINALYDAMQQGPGRQAIKPLLDRLCQYTVSHFKDEEQVMRERNYPELAQHRALHEAIRRKTFDLREHADLVTGRDLLRYLKEWWLGHIQSEDKKYEPYMECAGSGR